MPWSGEPQPLGFPREGEALLRKRPDPVVGGSAPCQDESVQPRAEPPLVVPQEHQEILLLPFRGRVRHRREAFHPRALRLEQFLHPVDHRVLRRARNGPRQNPAARFRSARIFFSFTLCIIALCLTLSVAWPGQEEHPSPSYFLNPFPV